MVDKIEQYAINQRQVYERIASPSLEEARAAVAPDFEVAMRHGRQYVHHVLNQYFFRRGAFYSPGRADVSELKILDFGCGVGRVMQAFHEAGVKEIDGCDISSSMLSHAKQASGLDKSRFFIGSGFDTGDAPTDYYDIAYAFLTFHHIPMRQTRIDLIRALSKNLRNEGMIFIEFKLYPGVTAGKIPPAHAHWTENKPSAGTNSDSDVFITTDALGDVYQDFRLFFYEISMTEIDTGEPHHEYNPDTVYNYGFNELHVVGQKVPSFKHFIDKGFNG